MNKDKIFQIIENKEWDRLIKVAEYERNLKQINLSNYF